MDQSAGAPIVLTAPLTESIDHAGFFIQMSLASIPGWMEWVIDKKYPTWREVPTTSDSRAGTAPAGLRVLEAVLAREFGADQVAVCYPDQLPTFIGERTRVVAVSTHNPLGTTFAAGVYASIFGSSREPVNMKAWTIASRIGLQTRWGKLSFGAGALALWAARLRRVNGPNFTWPLVQFSGAVPDRWLERTGRLYAGRPLSQVSRDDLLTSVRPAWRQAIARARASQPMAGARVLGMTAV